MSECAMCGEPIDNLRGYWRHTATRNPYCYGPRGIVGCCPYNEHDREPGDTSDAG